MELKLYNTLTRKKETFEPIDPSNVRMYVCGPTVYDYAHIGNARPAIVFDVLFRLLRHDYGADHVTYVRNITDVDDKINARALRDFPGLPLNEAIARVTQKTEEQYHRDVAALGCLTPTHEPHATAHIPGMVKMIQTLINKGHAYVATGGEGREVLFDVEAMPEYGQLSKRRLEEQQAGARVAVEAHKKNPADFVLWKESAADQPGWPGHFHWQGAHVDFHGRPGWHIECSVMSAHHLGEVFDIHGGGLDLIFPHHENEIAQSRCAHGTQVMANVWMHNGFLQVEGQKMSKSLGNFVTIHELLETEKFGGRRWPGEVLRLAMLMTHYREPIDFSVRRLEEAAALYRKWGRFSDQLGKVALEPDHYIIAPLMDDLDFKGVLDRIADLAPSANRVFFGGGEAPPSPESIEERAIDAQRRIVGTLRLLGFTFENASEHRQDDVTRQMVERRLDFIRNKNWAEADRIRDELLTQGVQLKDGKDPATGERVTTWEVRR